MRTQTLAGMISSAADSCRNRLACVRAQGSGGSHQRISQQASCCDKIVDDRVGCIPQQIVRRQRGQGLGRTKTDQNRARKQPTRPMDTETVRETLPVSHRDRDRAAQARRHCNRIFRFDLRERPLQDMHHTQIETDDGHSLLRGAPLRV
jgi:hypothetical protein